MWEWRLQAAREDFGGGGCALAELRRLAAENHRLACIAADKLAAVSGVSVLNDHFFNEFTIRLGQDAREVVRKLAEPSGPWGILAGVSLGRLYPQAEDLADGLLVTVTETTSEDDIDALVEALKEVLA